MIVATIVAAVIMGVLGIVAAMVQRMRNENAEQHGAVQRVISDHSAAIGGMQVEMKHVKKDVKRTRKDVREIRDAVVSRG